MGRMLSILSAALLTGCSTANLGTDGPTDTACRSFKPISASKADTDPTKRQVIAHNRAHDAICAAKAEKRVAQIGWP